MGWVLPLLAALGAIACVVWYVRAHATRLTAARNVMAALKERGVAVTRLDPRGVPQRNPEAALTAPEHGIALERSDGVRASMVFDRSQGVGTVPGFAGTAERFTLIELPLALPDHLILEPSRAQAAFGPFPPTPVPLGHPGFDRKFAVYVKPEASPSGYRSEPLGATPWAHSPHAAPLLATLDGLGFCGLHVHEGRGRLVFLPLAVDDMVHAMDAATALARPRPLAARRRRDAATGYGAYFAMLLFSMMPLMGSHFVLVSAAESGVELAGARVACPDGGAFRAQTRRHRASCTLPGQQEGPAQTALFNAWHWLLFGSLGVGFTAAVCAAVERRRAGELRAQLVSLRG